ncbi:MAG: disulfide bond formation protein B [Hydrogenibacillus schlegelii]|uniref:Disulfide bond formation protein B n=1 Tax=Hydrogenibacillus schlegelii TaxID=1484 RepID=A0A947CVH1_HYDSH|nr:disulfide bond formation protein B [Hydrogenibacillus schlegelii]MBT9283560.1 disulfide bond formation protein B [Hydrogenibacillus schlegelii]
MRGQRALVLAWLVALAASLGSLFLSEVLRYLPCELCWYQRICMFPLALLLGIAAFRKDAGIVVYALPLSLIGGGVALYHVILQKIPRKGGICAFGASCVDDPLNAFGFVTIPMLSFVAFGLISALLFRAKAPQALDKERHGW